jgi:sialic acid synthase SpsE|tara:strand:+ start:699 stop:1691 length:993 start_codon:yes stop_codon:yes gene_type:complete
MNKIQFITEIASTHNGNLKIINFLIHKHLKSASNFVKLQIFKADQLVDKSDINFKKFQKIQVKYQDWEKILQKYHKKTKIILEPFDLVSYNFCKKHKKKVYLKISTSESDNLTLIEDALQNFSKVFINVSGYERKHIDFLIKKFFNKYTKKKIVFLYGFQGFPSKPDDLRLSLFDFFKKKKIECGYSDHSLHGLSSDLIGVLPIILSKKISYFEKHVCKNLSIKPHDFISSVEFEDLNKLIRAIKISENLNHKKKFTKFSNSEKKYSLDMHKFAFSKRKAKKKHTINIDDLIFLRTKKKNGLRRQDFFYKKMVLKKDINKNTFLTRAFFK